MSAPVQLSPQDLRKLFILPEADFAIGGGHAMRPAALRFVGCCGNRLQRDILMCTPFEPNGGFVTSVFFQILRIEIVSPSNVSHVKRV